MSDLLADLATSAGDKLEHSCEQCERPFEPTRVDAKFCSAACRQRAYRERCRSARVLQTLEVGLQALEALQRRQRAMGV